MGGAHLYTLEVWRQGVGAAHERALALLPKEPERTDDPRDFSAEAVARRRQQSKELLGQTFGRMPRNEAEAQAQAKAVAEKNAEV